MTSPRSNSPARTTTRQQRLLADLVALSAEIQEQRRIVDRLVAKRHASYQRLYDAGISVGTIAREIGVTPWAVRQHLRPVSTSTSVPVEARAPGIHVPAAARGDLRSAAAGTSESPVAASAAL